jgi:hypothetical protein
MARSKQERAGCTWERCMDGLTHIKNHNLFHCHPHQPKDDNRCSNLPAAGKELKLGTADPRDVNVTGVWGERCMLQTMNKRAVKIFVQLQLVCNFGYESDKYTLSQIITAVPMFTLSPPWWSYMYKAQPLKEAVWPGRGSGGRAPGTQENSLDPENDMHPV